MTTQEQRIKTRLTDIYHLSPILWAIFKGENDAGGVARRLGKPEQGVRRGIRGAIHAGIIIESSGKLRPNLSHHRKLYHELFPGSDVSYSSHPAIELVDGKAKTTGEIAKELNRTYHSTYKTLQRIQAAGHITREGKRWIKVT